jgi:hypothetical protein
MKDTMKRYIGIAGDALAYAFRRDTEIQAGVRETDPPVGSKDQYGSRGSAGAVIGGLSGTTILLLVAAWYFLKR